MTKRAVGLDTPAAVLLSGLVALSLLPLVAMLAVSLHPLVAMVVGSLELGTAWWIKTSPAARALRLLLALFGSLTGLLGVLYLFA